MKGFVKLTQDISSKILDKSLNISPLFVYVTIHIPDVTLKYLLIGYLSALV